MIFQSAQREIAEIQERLDCDGSDDDSSFLVDVPQLISFRNFGDILGIYNSFLNNPEKRIHLRSRLLVQAFDINRKLSGKGCD